MAERLYFAYGSNINLEQMAVRCPAAQVVGPAVLDGYELLFRGNRRGTGVATIEPLPGSQVHGLLWKLTPECERSLDVYEGYPRLYEKENITVRTGDGKDVVVMAYIMTGELWRDPTIPSPAYYGGILEGYRQNGVTVDALETLKIVGIAYGVYDHAEDLRDCRVTLENGERPALVVQEDVSLHGSPFWETVRTITDDPERIRQYVAFRETLKMFQQIEREREVVQRDTGRSSQQGAPAKRKDCHER